MDSQSSQKERLSESEASDRQAEDLKNLGVHGGYLDELSKKKATDVNDIHLIAPGEIHGEYLDGLAQKKVI